MFSTQKNKAHCFLFIHLTCYRLILTLRQNYNKRDKKTRRLSFDKPVFTRKRYVYSLYILIHNSIAYKCI